MSLSNVNKQFQFLGSSRGADRKCNYGMVIRSIDEVFEWGTNKDRQHGISDCIANVECHLEVETKNMNK